MGRVVCQKLPVAELVLYIDLLVGGKTNLVMMPARTVLVVIYFELTYSWSHNNNII